MELYYKNIICINCGGPNHTMKMCKDPITSFGMIAFKVIQNENDDVYKKALDTVQPFILGF